MKYVIFLLIYTNIALADTTGTLPAPPKDHYDDAIAYLANMDRTSVSETEKTYTLTYWTYEGWYQDDEPAFFVFTSATKKCGLEVNVGGVLDVECHPN